jgi:hypothetical protein
MDHPRFIELREEVKAIPLMWAGKPTSWEPQEKGMMSTVANFPSVRNQGMSNPGKSQTSEGDAD